MAMGELIDRSASFWRRHLGALFKLFLGFELVRYLLYKGYELVLKTWLPLLRGGANASRAVESNPDEALKQVLLAVPSLAALMSLYVLVAWFAGVAATDRKSTRLNSSHIQKSRMPSSA